MSITIDGTVQLRSAITITCEARFAFDVQSGQVLLFWTKDSATVLVNSSEVFVGTVVQVDGANTYQSNVSLNSIAESDSGIYTCTVSVFHPLVGDRPVTRVGIAATYIAIQCELRFYFLVVFMTIILFLYFD